MQLNSTYYSRRWGLSQAGMGMIIFVFCFLACPLVRADVLTVGTKKHKGTFESYDNNRFIFRTDKGKRLRESRASVSSLTLDEPREIYLVRSSRKKPATLTLLGYEKSRFSIEKDGKKSTVVGMQVRAITVKQVFAAGGLEGQGDAPGPVQAIDTSGVESRQDLTADQQAIIKRYKSAQKQYDTFLSQTSAMVKQMDGATGSRREGMLNALRLRKDKEQPIKSALGTSRDALLKAFPDVMNGGGGPANEQAGAPEQFVQSVEISIVLPKVGENEVMILDTDMFKQMGKLTTEQEAAIKKYEEVSEEYKRAAASSIQGAQESKKKLKAEQEALLKAFPNLKIVTEE